MLKKFAVLFLAVAILGTFSHRDSEINAFKLQQPVVVKA